MAEGSAPRPDGGTRLTPALRAQIERWFVRRGVPQLIEGYSTEPRMDARAAPFISAWLVIGTVAFWGTRPDWPPALNATGAIGTLAFMAVGYTVVGWLRGRRPWSRPEKFDFGDIALFGFLPAVPAALIGGSLSAGMLAGPNALLGVGAIYIVIAFGLLEIGGWAVGRLRFHLVHIVGLVSRTLPLLLILVAFLLFSAEIWEAAHALDAAELAAVLALLLFVAVVLVVNTFRPVIGALELRADWAAVLDDARGTPAGPLADGLRSSPRPVPRLNWLQRTNLYFLVAIDQLLQSLFVALLVMAFLVAFGLLVLPVTVQEGWVGEPLRTLASFALLGEERIVSGELLTVAALLSGIVGLYFTGLALTDAAYRAEHFTRIEAELRELLSARTVYLAAIQGAPDRGPGSATAQQR